MFTGKEELTPKKVDGSLFDWVGESTWIGGASSYSKGEFIYQDYLFDDHGAGTGQEPQGNTSLPEGNPAFWDPFTLCKPIGSYRYPNDQDRFGGNCADLLQLRMAADKDNIYFLVQLNTLLVPDSTVVGIAFDTTEETPNPKKHPVLEWPFDAGIATVGTDHVLTLWGTGGAWDNLDLKSVGGQVAVNVEDSVIEASIPRELLGTLKFWCYAATGLWDNQNKAWLIVKERRDETYPGGGIPNGPRVFNLAFRSHESGTWFEARQAAFLQLTRAAEVTGSKVGALNIAAQFVDLDNHPDTPLKPPYGYYERIYRFSTPLGKGVSETGIEARGATGAKLLYSFLGKYQPYAIYVPENYEGVLLYLHGGLSNHTALIQEGAFQRDLGDYGRNIIVSPLGLGPLGGWVDHSYLDALEVLNDVINRYGINRDRVYISGWSMGGQGANRFLVTRPDIFAASFQLAPGEIRRPRNQLDIQLNPGTTIDLYDNVRHIPILFVLGGKDTTGNTEFALEKTKLLKDIGYEYRSFFQPLFGHTEFARPAFFKREADWLKIRKLIKNPAHVTYKICEAWWRPDISPKLIFDQAYWVSGLRVRDNSDGLSSFGKVDAVSHALDGSEPGLKHFNASSPGPPSYYEIEGQDYIWPGKKLEAYNGFSATLENLKEISFDMKPMGIDISQQVLIKLSNDGASRLLLLASWPPVQVTVNNQPYRRFGSGERGLRLEIDKGDLEIKIESLKTER